MNLTRRNFAAGIAAAAGLHVVVTTADTVKRMLVGFPAGGTADTTARRVAEAWGRAKGATFVVDNRSGAGGQLGVTALKSALPDGQTVLLSPASIMTIYPHVYRKLPYNPATDAYPLASVCSFACGFAIGPQVPAAVTTFAQFLDWARAHPDAATYASPAAGAGPHFVGALMARSTKTPLLHVPYRGASPGLQDLMGGMVASGMFVMGDYFPFLSTGKLRLLAVSSATRSRFAPSTPTFTELGFPDVVSTETFGLFLPANPADTVVDTMYELARLAVEDPAVRDGMARIGLEPKLSAKNAYAKQLARERAEWEPLVKQTGFSIDD